LIGEVGGSSDIKNIKDTTNSKGSIIENAVKSESYTYEGASVTVKPNEANGDFAHAEGFSYNNIDTTVQANGLGSHAEGIGSKATAKGSHAEGIGTAARGIGSHTGGEGTIAQGDYQTVIGGYNEIDPENNYALIIGNGENNENRSNAFSISWDGSITIPYNREYITITPRDIVTMSQGAASLTSDQIDGIINILKGGK